MIRLTAILIAISASAPAVAAPRVDDGRIVAFERRVDALSRRLDRLERAPAGRASKHAWPDLTEDEKAALTAVLKSLPKTVKFDIVCNDATCVDLAMDIDDAMEAAGLVSVLDRSLGPLGYGIAVQVNAADKPAAEEAIDALRKATGGRLDVPLTEAPNGATPPGYVSIVIGKFRK